MLEWSSSNSVTSYFIGDTSDVNQQGKERIHGVMSRVCGNDVHILARLFVFSGNAAQAEVQRLHHGPQKDLIDHFVNNFSTISRIPSEGKKKPSIDRDYPESGDFQSIQYQHLQKCQYSAARQWSRSPLLLASRNFSGVLAEMLLIGFQC
jgi:hypothetical protein